MTPVDLVPCPRHVGGRTNRGVWGFRLSRFRCHLLYLLGRLLRRSCARSDQREVCPLARGVIFPCGATPICPITEQRSLLPSSFADRAIGRFCNPLSCRSGAQPVYHVPHVYHAWVRLRL